jgi:hypothetical protein
MQKLCGSDNSNCCQEQQFCMVCAVATHDVHMCHAQCARVQQHYDNETDTPHTPPAMICLKAVTQSSFATDNVDCHDLSRMLHQRKPNNF